MENLLEIVKNAGIAGAGGAGFPTHVKLDAKADIVIINGAECEPLLRVDQQMMAMHPERLLDGFQLIVDQVGAGEGVIALKAKYHDAEEALLKHIGRYPKLRIHRLGNFYPAGDEQVTVFEVCGRIVPEGGIPLHVGVVVCNVETVLNIMDAREGKPVTASWVTITGAVNKPVTLLLPLGISVAEAIEQAGGAAVPDYKVVNGGPMMGKLVSIDSRVTKTTKGLIVLPEGHSLLNSLDKGMGQMMREAQVACMQCSLCTEVCPRHLLGHRLDPHKLMRTASYGSLADGEMTIMNAHLCCECRLCEYACVMQLQPWKLNQLLKANMRKVNMRNELNNKPEHVLPFREYKLYSVHKLITQLGLDKYDRPAPVENTTAQFSRVTIPLSQHVGAPGEPVVSIGDSVAAGDLIAKIPEGALGANIHASIGGKVTAMDNNGITIEAS